MSALPDHRLSSPSALRNRDPILDVLRDILAPSGCVLEIASGSGEHILHFARYLPHHSWQPSDPSPEARASIAAWITAEGATNVVAPLAIDAAASSWPVGRADAIVAINMVHISPWRATEGLMQGAGRLLPPGGPLLLYGPYRRAGHDFEPSNAWFDADLRARNSEWGVRALEDVAHAAEVSGLRFEKVIEMPANNLSVVFRRV
jgi:SAM-dependent methyltransferase